MWTGLVQPQFSETYTFYTTTDDGTRLWVNGQLVVDRWVDQGATEAHGSITLQGSQKYPITMEYYENGGDASATLAWSSPSTTKTIIPQSQLYPVAPAAFSTPLTTFGKAPFNLEMTGLVGKGYVLQATTNLNSWVSILTNMPAADPNQLLPSNVFDFIDPLATNFPRRFYRSFQQP
jgi:hypothetical protein